MRCVWLLVIACLTAATATASVRAERRSAHEAQVDLAPVSLAHVARRQSSYAPDLRLPPFVVTPIPLVAAPPRVVALQEWQLEPPSVACAVAHPCARGPPMA
jgi:hypothetical protein